ncbi:MAG: acyltransferase [Halioglobus sp.]
MKLTQTFSYILYYGFARWLPASVSPYGGKLARKIRFAICKPLFLECGCNVNIEHGAEFGSGAKLKIGHNSGIGVNCRVPYDVTIGSDVMMGPGVSIIGVNHRIDDPTRPMIDQGYDERKPCTIKNDVWIGRNAIIMAGVTLGEGTVIAGGAVVTKDVCSFDIVGGNPARVIRNRRESTQVGKNPGDN